MKEFAENTEKAVATKYTSSNILIKHSVESKRPSRIISYPHIVFQENKKRAKSKIHSSYLHEEYFESMMKKLRDKFRDK